MDYEDEKTWAGRNGSVSQVHLIPQFELDKRHRMATGPGMSPSEWEELPAQVDESFWVMRIIGKSLAHIE